MIWFTSDPHYWHKNIAGPKVSVWKGGYRDFEDEKEMSQHIVKIFNKYVKHDDVLYCLGDWNFAGINNCWNFRKQLECREIHLIYGNHDHNIISNKEIVLLVEDWDRYEYLSGYEIDVYDKNNGRTGIEPQNLFKSCDHYKEISINGQGFCLSHYKHFIWQGQAKGWIHLYGHSHASAEKHIIGKSMDVGIDNAKLLLGEYRPFSITEVINLMNKRDVYSNDHHTEKSNLR